MQLTNEADLSFPIILTANGRVMDGMNRVARAILDGNSTISAFRFDIDPDPDYRNCSPEDLPYDLSGRPGDQGRLLLLTKTNPRPLVEPALKFSCCWPAPQLHQVVRMGASTHSAGPENAS